MTRKEVEESVGYRMWRFVAVMMTILFLSTGIGFASIAPLSKDMQDVAIFILGTELILILVACAAIYGKLELIED